MGQNSDRVNTPANNQGQHETVSPLMGGGGLKLYRIFLTIKVQEYFTLVTIPAQTV